jgi:hypothetical protein
MAKGKNTVTVHRSSVDGKFITKKQAERKPRESVKETIKK